MKDVIDDMHLKLSALNICMSNQMFVNKDKLSIFIKNNNISNQVSYLKNNNLHWMKIIQSVEQKYPKVQEKMLIPCESHKTQD